MLVEFPKHSRDDDSMHDTEIVGSSRSGVFQIDLSGFHE